MKLTGLLTHKYSRGKLETSLSISHCDLCKIMAASRPEHSRIYSLPNEVTHQAMPGLNWTNISKLLMQILNFFQSKHLLLLAAVSRRFRDLAAHIVYGRLTVATSLKDHKLLLECYHPINKYTEPYLFCELLHTLEWSNDTTSPRPKGEVGENDDRLGSVTTLYSSFKPVRANGDPKPTRLHPARNIPDDQGIDDLSGAFSVALSEVEDDLMTRTVNLDSYELFSQLCINVALVKVGPRRGVFLSCIDILKKRTARIWRQWLLENSCDSAHGEPERMIWADQHQNLGLKVRVREMKAKHHASILQPIDENEAISYKLKLEGV